MVKKVARGRAGRAQRDAWKIKPPCQSEIDRYCHDDCPYYGDCWPDEEYEEDE